MQEYHARSPVPVLPFLSTEHPWSLFSKTVSVGDYAQRTYHRVLVQFS